MIICMYDILCVTNRRLCKGDFLQRLGEISAAGPAGIVLREKDLSPEAYKALAKEVWKICGDHQVTCILHNFQEVAQELGCQALHLPLPVLRRLSADERSRFTHLGASCHSVEEAQEAEKLGCTYIIAGHIFDTDCKKDLPGRGINFLEKMCESVSIPVYAIGGIRAENIARVRSAGAKGACLMSSVMECDHPKEYLMALKGVSDKNEI